MRLGRCVACIIDDICINMNVFIGVLCSEYTCVYGTDGAIFIVSKSLMVGGDSSFAPFVVVVVHIR